MVLKVILVIFEYKKFYILSVLSKVKTSVRSPYQHKFAADTFSNLKLQFQQCFSDLKTSAKEFFVFQILFHYEIANLPPNLSAGAV